MCVCVFMLDSEIDERDRLWRGHASFHHYTPIAPAQFLLEVIIAKTTSEVVCVEHLNRTVEWQANNGRHSSTCSIQTFGSFMVQRSVGAGLCK